MTEKQQPQTPKAQQGAGTDVGASPAVKKSAAQVLDEYRKRMYENYKEIYKQWEC